MERRRLATGGVTLQQKNELSICLGAPENYRQNHRTGRDPVSRFGFGPLLKKEIITLIHLPFTSKRWLDNERSYVLL